MTERTKSTKLGISTKTAEEKSAARRTAAKDMQVEATGAGEIRGGTKNVLIEYVPMPARPGRPQKEEAYPFSMLEPSVMKGKEIVGPSFFIPETENPDRHLAAARKRIKGSLFWKRKAMGRINGEGPEVPGVRIWRGGKGMKA